MLCKRNCNRLCLSLFCEVWERRNTLSMKKQFAASDWSEVFFFFDTCDLSMRKFRKWRRVLTCISVAVVIGVYWCSTIYLNMIKKKVYDNNLPHVCSLSIYIQWFAKKKKKKTECLSSEPMLYKNNVNFRPICWFLRLQRHMAFCM